MQFLPRRIQVQNKQPPHQANQIVYNPLQQNTEETKLHLLLNSITEGGKWLEIGQDGTIREQETGLIGPEPVIVPGDAAEQLQEIMYTQIPNDHGNVYYIEFPVEMDTQKPEQGELQLDGATEDELIGSWNDRLSLKRERRTVMGLEAIEEELLRRKKQKREAWYDEYGRLICVTISDEHGTKTLVRNEQGRLEPNNN